MVGWGDVYDTKSIHGHGCRTSTWLFGTWTWTLHDTWIFLSWTIEMSIFKFLQQASCCYSPSSINETQQPSSSSPCSQNLHSKLSFNKQLFWCLNDRLLKRVLTFFTHFNRFSSLPHDQFVLHLPHPLVFLKKSCAIQTQ